ncbi:hypothetical protein [Neobacillus niacini]|uniref:hypothetical protein n=1 Tax=Neobacillus niacini TaxID=86668 RepID=UPI0039833E80
MNIIMKQEIEHLFETLKPVLEELNFIALEERELSQVFTYYLFLQQCGEDIMTNSSYTSEEILYSQYYWFVQFRNLYFSKIGYDSGIDQQAILLIEKISNELEGNVDWGLVEEFEPIQLCNNK